MTNKEAINALKLEGGLEISGKPKRVAEFMEGLSVAVEALESLDEARRAAREAEKRRETFQKIVEEYQEKFIPQYKERAERAERKLAVALEDIYSGNVGDCNTCIHGCDYDDDCESMKKCEYKWRGESYGEEL